MKLVELDAALKSFDGVDIKALNEKKEEVPLTRRVALLNLIGPAKPETGAQSINFYKLGVSIATRDSKDVGVSVEDLTLIKTAIEQNNPSYYNVVTGQLLDYINCLGEKSE
jgi:hypothetical protein